MTKPRKKRAPARWKAKFLDALAESSNVTAAAKKAGIDKSVVYKTRRSDTDFNRDWQRALAEGYDNLEMDLLHRLRIGQLEGGKTQARRKYDNAIAFRLLIAHREAVTRHRAIRADEDEEAVIASITRKLELMRQRQLAAAADDAAYAARAAAKEGDE
ncbi:hypothetical protein [Tsuneonella mangrovi]|uniref:hypothetical protein n=1 Tax=Tsuneonella mangrovi TaxID=1982042 RepID=UPI000BA21599|nr:hypothetical protein [Tsuneonella mangrovi]